MENVISASVNSDLKLYKCGIFLSENKSFCAFCCRKIASFEVPTLTWNCTNAIIYCKTRLFEWCTVENPICETLNFDLKLHKCNILQLNTSIWEFCDGKSDLCKCQLWLEIAKMGYSIAKHVFLCVLWWKISFLQVQTRISNSTIAIIHRHTRLVECFTVENQICATVNSDFQLHKWNIPQQNTFFWMFWSGKSDLCKCQLWL